MSTYLWVLVEDFELSYNFISNKEKIQHFTGFSVFPTTKELS